jgi:hypothetical protein
MDGFEMTHRDALTQTRPKCLFSVADANRALPLVGRVVSDIVVQYRELERLQRQRRKYIRQDRREEVTALDRRAVQGAQRLNDLVNEVNAIGCELKDWQSGQVDFRTLYKGREVYLCWKLGEVSVRHWHELYAGSVERRPIDEKFSALDSLNPGK